MSERRLTTILSACRLGLCLALFAGWHSGAFGWPAESGPSAAAGQPPAKASPPPLLIEDDEAPMLLNEATNAVTAFSGADINAACFVCHGNFRTDPFVQAHSKTNIGCVKCHGESPEHVADEANLTPPEMMYWPSKIRISCVGCHPVHKAPAHEVLARWAERCPQKTNATFVVCTDCHGAHRMDVRSIVWDKRSGRLLSKAKPIIIRDPTAPPAAPVKKEAEAAPKDSSAALSTALKPDATPKPTPD